MSNSISDPLEYYVCTSCRTIMKITGFVSIGRPMRDVG